MLADIVTVAAGACARMRTAVELDGVLVARDACDLRAGNGAVATIVAADAAGNFHQHFVAALDTFGAQAGVRAGIGTTGPASVVPATAPHVWPSSGSLMRCCTPLDITNLQLYLGTSLCGMRDAPERLRSHAASPSIALDVRLSADSV